MKSVSNFLLLSAALLVGCAGTTAKSDKQEAPAPAVVDTTCPGPLKIVGISIRTTNKNGQSMKDIESLWGRFWSEKVSDKVTNKISDDIYAVYTDYENGVVGKYTTLIGYAVDSKARLKKGLTAKQINPGPCKMYVSKGKMPEAVVKTWQEIWSDTNLKRAYREDFTVHGKKYHEGDKAEVETYISVK